MWFRVITFGCLLTLGCLTLSSISSAQTTWIVDDDDGTWADYQNIQDAINISSDGDTILVYQGTYYENIIINESVTIEGNGSTKTYIDGGDSGHVVEIHSDNVNLTNLRLTDSDAYGLLILADCINLSYLTICYSLEGINGTFNHSTIHDIVIIDCDDGGGMGIVNGSHNVLRDNRIISHGYNGVVLMNGSNFNILNGNEFTSNFHHGVEIIRSSNITISNNEISNNMWFGIYVRDGCHDIIINDNLVDDNYRQGVLFKNNGTGIQLFNNTFRDQPSGIWLYRDGYTTIEIFNNSFFGNKYGVRLLGNHNNRIIGNNFSHNEDFGVYARESNGSTIRHNDFSSCYRGVSLNTCYHMKVFGNNFYNHSADSGGYDTTSGNQWDNGTTGNYWDDYNGTDNNDDGIGDTPYSIGGSSNATDRYPLIVPVNTSEPVPITEFPLLPTVVFFMTVVLAVFRPRRPS